LSPPRPLLQQGRPGWLCPGPRPKETRGFLSWPLAAARFGPREGHQPPPPGPGSGNHHGTEQSLRRGSGTPHPGRVWGTRGPPSTGAGCARAGRELAQPRNLPKCELWQGAHAPPATSHTKSQHGGVGRDLWGPPAQPPAQAGSPTAGCTAPRPGGLEYLQRRRLPSLPGQPGPGLRHPQQEEVLPHVLAVRSWVSRRRVPEPAPQPELSAGCRRSEGFAPSQRAAAVQRSQQLLKSKPLSSPSTAPGLETCRASAFV